MRKILSKNKSKSFIIIAIIAIIIIVVVGLLINSNKTQESDATEESSDYKWARELIQLNPGGDYLGFINAIKKNTNLSISEAKNLLKEHGILEDIEPIKPSELAEKQLQNYYDAYKNPYVLHIRKALNDYLNGINVGDDSKSGLANFNKDYYKSKFIVLSINNALFEGKEIQIVFQDRPDKIFSARIYKQTDDKYDLKTFSESPLSAEEQSIILKRFQNFILDKEHSL